LYSSTVFVVPPIVEVDVKLIEGIIVKAGSTIRMPAIMRGLPVPIAKWVIDGEEIKSEGNIKIDTDNFSTVLSIADCTRSHTGIYILTVSNSAGSKTVSLNVTALDVPSAPIGPVNILELTPEYMVIDWRPPKEDGGSPVTNYIVEKRESNKETWGGVSSGSTATRLKISRLQQGVEYVVRIRAENKMGIGAALESAPTVARHQFEPPGHPGKPVASDISEDSLTLGWTMPLFDGGSPISGYIIERRHKGGKWIRVNKTPCKDLRYRVLGLFESIEYEFRVFAENIAGFSGPSPISDPARPCRPITVPGPPINPKIKDYSCIHADLVWIRPTKDGGSPVLGYIVECHKEGAEWEKVNKDDLIKQCAYRVKGLIEDTEYRFRVKAVNMIGEGETREIPESVIAKDIVIPPEIEMDATCRERMTVRVGHNINLVAYVKARPDPEITWSKGESILEKGKRTTLINNFPVVQMRIKEATRADHGKYVLKAANEAGEASATISVNVLDRPGHCQNLKMTYVTKNSCMVSWDAPEDNGGTEITNYIVECREPSIRTWSMISSDCTNRMVKAKLMENHEYLFRVSAENKCGPGPATETKTPILAIDPLQKPSEPENFHVSDIGKHFVFLKWRKPDYDGGSPNLGFHLERKAKDAEEWEKVHEGVLKETFFMVDKCVENQTYQFRVQSTNDGGESAWVKTSEILVKEEVQKPVIDLKFVGTIVVKAGESVRLEAGIRGKPQPEVTWVKDKATGDNPRISIDTGYDYSKFLLTKTKRSDTGKYVVTATNSAGSFTAYANVTVLDIPGPVRDMKISGISTEKCRVVWDPPEDDGGCEVDSYILEKCETRRMVWSTYSASVVTNYCNVTRLVEGNEYIFRVRAENKMGTGPPMESKPITAKTQFNRPGPPDAPEVTKIGKDEMTVVWAPPENDGGKSITGYILERKEKRAVRWVPVTKSPISERRMKVTNLIPNHDYQFRVKAENEVGLGEPSKASRPITAKDPIGMYNLYFIYSSEIV